MRKNKKQTNKQNKTKQKKLVILFKFVFTSLIIGKEDVYF